MSDFRSLLTSFAHDLEREDEALFNLWSWLPSEHFAKKAHGDYACEFRASRADQMTEACMLLSILAGYDDRLDNYEERSWFKCPCEECEVPERAEIEEVIQKFRGKAATSG